MTYDDDYLRFYEIYPRHEGKADGQKAWSGLSDSDKTCAMADVEKRKRMYAYSSNMKLIQLPASYLRASRWEDDWQSTLESSRKGDELPNTGEVTHAAFEITELATWQERMFNWVFLRYLLVSGGLSETVTALKIKNDMMKKEVPAIDMEPKLEQVETLSKLFLTRLDVSYGLEHRRQAYAAFKQAMERANEKRDNG